METGPNKTDWLVSVARGVLGGLPFVGSLVGEVVANVIPHQRLDRLEAFLRALEREVASLNGEGWRERFVSPAFVDLLEDGFFQAARSMTGERRQHIARILKNSLTEQQLTHLETKRLLGLLGELNDLEILILQQHATRSYAERQAFEAAHPEVVIQPKPYSSPREDHEREALQRSYLTHLVQLGLLRPDYQVPRFEAQPKFDDKTGTLVARGHRITPLGSLMLRMLDVDPERAA